MHASTVKERLDPLARTAEGLRLLLLVGSTARGEQHQRSDVDLAYLADHRFDPATFAGLATAALETDAVDLTDLCRANGLFRYEAARHGMLLHGDPEVSHDFRLRSLQFWYDASRLIDAAYDRVLADLG